MIPQYKAVGARLQRRAGDLDIPADQAILQAMRQVADYPVLQHDRVLDLATLDHTVVVDRGEWADAAIDDPGVLAINARPADGAIADLSAFLENHIANQLRVTVDVPFPQRRQLFQDQAVRLQHIVLLAGVDPPALVDVREPLPAMLDQPLDRIGDL